MQWIKVPGNVTGGMDVVMQEQVDALRQQMATMTEESVGGGPLADDAADRTAAMMMRRYKSMFARRR